MTDQDVHPDAGRWGGWTWRDPARGEHFRRCNYCGSLHPEDLAAEPVWRADWADQKYGWPHKFYVDIPNRDPDTLYVVGSTRSSKPGSPLGTNGDWVAIDDLTPEQREAAERDGYLEATSGVRLPTFFTFGTHENHFGKFYTIHLSDAGLDNAVKHAVEQRSGLTFTFHSGRVSWKPTAPDGA